MWYLRKIAWVAMIGFLAGAAVFLLLYPMLIGMLPVADVVTKVVAPH
jgi:predicted exporter